MKTPPWPFTAPRSFHLSPMAAAAAVGDSTPNDETKDEEKGKKEGRNLLGQPTFEELDNGRFRCVETGHEMPSKAMDSYSISKRCRLGLVEFALSRKRPPLNMFKPDPLSSSKIICKLTGDTINKSEEHIWKHINGKRFLNKLEQKEAEKLTSNGAKQGEPMPLKVPKLMTDDVKKNKTKKEKKKERQKEKSRVENIASKPRKFSDKESDSEEEGDFWMPPVGSRWDFDDGGDRWGSDTEQENDESTDGLDGECEKDSAELSIRTKRMSIEVGPSSFAPRKKSKTESSS